MMYKSSIKELSQLLHTKKISSHELAQYYLKRINAFDSELNCFISVDEETALKAAYLADEKLALNQGTPLTGIPLSHKDLFCTQGLKTSCGSKMLDNFISPYDAHIVEQLKNAGTVLLGKNNMDEFAMGSSNENSYYGPVLNPWNKLCVPGGSSGGSAASVAARLTPWATGSDTGGSIRQPAAFCGVTGLKPTYGRVSRYGMVAFASSLDQAGPIAPSAEDIALIMNHMSGHDERDSTSALTQVPDFTKRLNDPIDGLTIGLPKAFIDDSLSPKVQEKIQQCLTTLEKRGAKLVEVELNYLSYSIACYYIIASAEASSNLSRFDGVRFGHRCLSAQNLQELYEKSRSEGFGEEVKRRIITGTYTLSSGYFDAYYVKAQQVRRLIRDDFLNALEKVDVLLTPTTPTPAFKLGEKNDDPVSMYLSDIYTVAVNLAGLPALSMPIGLIDDLPVGAQLIGRHFDEYKILNLAHCYQIESDWHKQVPASTDKEV